MTTTKTLSRAARSGAWSLLSLACLLVFLLGSASVARAEMSAYPVHGSFTEDGRFTVRNLDLNNQGNRLVLAAGGTVHAELDVYHHCQGCGGAINQVIVGFGGATDAQACVWQGGRASNGWQRVSFTLQVPRQAGTYQVRARYAQAYTCGDALGWWRVDRPDGPDLSSNIGLITVVPAHTGPPALPPGSARSVAEIMADIDARVGRMEKMSANIEQLSQGRLDRRTLARLRKLSRKMSAYATEARQLQGELAQALARDRRDWDAPIQLDPPVSILPIPHGPTALPRHELDALVQRLRAEGFESSRMNLLRDAIRARAHFDAAQALLVMEQFGFGSSKVEAGTLLCQVMVEPGALPRMTAALTYESDRRQLRRRTGGHCGPQ